MNMHGKCKRADGKRESKMDKEYEKKVKWQLTNTKAKAEFISVSL